MGKVEDSIIINGLKFKKKCSCGFNQSHPIPHTHDMTERERLIKKAYEKSLDEWEEKGFDNAKTMILNVLHKMDGYSDERNAVLEQARHKIIDDVRFKPTGR